MFFLCSPACQKSGRTVSPKRHNTRGQVADKTVHNNAPAAAPPAAAIDAAFAAAEEDQWDKVLQVERAAHLEAFNQGQIPRVNHPDGRAQVLYSDHELQLLRACDGLEAPPFNVATQLDEAHRQQMSEEDWDSIRVNQAWVTSTVLKHWIAFTNHQRGDGTRILLADPYLQMQLFQCRDHLQSVSDVARTWRQRHTPQLQHLLIPVNLQGEHWALLDANLQERSIRYLDSIPKKWPAQVIKKRLQEFLNGFTQTRGRWNMDVEKNVPKQRGSNCGVFVIEFMRAIVNDVPLERVQEAGMVEARAQIVRELQEQRVTIANQ